MSGCDIITPQEREHSRRQQGEVLAMDVQGTNEKVIRGKKKKEKVIRGSSIRPSCPSMRLPMFQYQLNK